MNIDSYGSQKSVADSPKLELAGCCKIQYISYNNCYVIVNDCCVKCHVFIVPWVRKTTTKQKILVSDNISCK